VYFVFNGTAANSLALASLCQSYHSVICHELAHVETDECGGPEFFSNGSKLLPVGGAGGKLTPAAVQEVITRRSDIHFPKPRVVTLTQATEVGTVYRPDEVAAVAELAHARGLRVHMDGARFCNAVASLGVAPADITWRAGVDVLCFGGTKMGLPVGEAVVFFDRTLSEDFAWRCKQAGQLASKMRFLSAPWLGMLEGDAWLRHAAHANAMAQRLATGLAGIPGARLLFPVEANGVFVALPDKVQGGLRERGWRFYTFIAAGGARLMCAWDTQPESVDALLADLRELSS
ncbi:MAG: low specificity L-threonine aldolase, partial [Simplicispira sp.]|nr:low specificity L-threonine aldolase [Simplicispira sp.]